MSSQVNILLVHGAFSDGSIWSDVMPFLQAAGHHVLAIQLSLLSFSDDVARTKSALASLSGPTLLVGHSYGGMVITGAGTGAQNAIGLIYIAATVPDEGETGQEINGKFPPSEGLQALVPSYEENTVWINPDAFHRVFCADIDPLRASVLAAVQKPTSMDCVTEKVGPPAWEKLPSWYLISEQDKTVPPESQHWMTQRANCTTSTIASSHASLIAYPQKVADFILSAVQESAK